MATSPIQEHRTRDAQPGRRKLPIGIQTLAEVITQGHYYVDKTGFALQLIRDGKYYFLSRPRRFGKSLFLDTLKEIFEGNQALFSGLQIEPDWDWSVRHPVLRLSFGGGDLADCDDLEESVRQQLEEYERQFSLPPRYKKNRSRFRDLIGRLHRKCGQTVVVLVDEYDKPLLDNIDNLATSQAMRKALRDIYSIIKECDAHIRFAFMTGVSKFSKVSLFSGINNLEDITLAPAFSGICGYTDADLDTVFAPELPGLDRAEIRRWYNGYNWRGEAVYNPYDVLLLFKRREFGIWWYQSATPTFLVKLLVERQTWLPDLARLEADAELVDCFDVDSVSPVALMFQSGYLTIKREELLDGEPVFQLGFPNFEVARSFHSSLLGRLTENPEAVAKNRNTLRRLLAEQDFAGMERLFQAFFAGIPYQWHVNNEVAQYEGYYASVFYGYFAALGLDVRVEDSSSRGRIDMALRHSGHIYLFEFKVVERNPPGAALQQIKDKGYADKYRAEGLPIHMVGVEFSQVARNVVRFDFEMAGGKP